MKDIIVILLFGFFISCQFSNEKDDSSTDLDRNLNEIYNGELNETMKRPPSKDIENFNEYLSELVFEDLPFIFNAKHFRYFDSFTGNEEQDLKELWGWDINSYYKCENLTKYDEPLVFSDTLLSYLIPLNSSFNLFSCRILKKFKVFEYSVFLSTFSKDEKTFYILCTYKDNKIISHRILGRLFISDEYNKFGIQVFSSGEVHSINYSNYETNPQVNYQHFRINSKGFIRTVQKDQFELGLEPLYQDFKSFDETRKINLNIANLKSEFEILSSEIRQVNLPFQISVLIDSISELQGNKSELLPHEKLNYSRMTSNFISKKDGQVAFKLDDEKFESGNYFYPIFQFKRNSNITVIGWIYQSFSDFTPVVIIQLNTYSSTAEIIDSRTIYRNMEYRDFRFTNTVQWNTDFCYEVKNVKEYNKSEHRNHSTKILKSSKFEISDSGKIIQVN